MLAESLVLVDAGVLPLVCSWRADVRVRPLGASSDFRAVSIDGRVGYENDGPAAPSLELSMLIFPVSIDGLVMALIASSGIVRADELDGRVGGDGGAPIGYRWTLLGGTTGCSH